MSFQSYSSVAALLKYLRYAQELGLDCTQALAYAQIDPQQLKDNNSRIPLHCHEQLLTLLCQQSQDPLFGLHSARFVQPASWGVLGYITMNCATLGQAMSRILPYEKLVGDMGTSRIEQHGAQLAMIWQCRQTNPALRRQLVEHVLASWLIYARRLIDQPANPDAVYFEHSQPSGTTLADYQQVFGCPVLFNQAFNGLLGPAAFLELPVQQADAQLLHTLEDHASSQLAELAEPRTIDQQVRDQLRLMLKEGMPRKERLAEQFHMTVRTLQRHLEQTGTSYQQILDELRLELAQVYLKQKNLPLEQIASRLGFSEPRSFHRSFKNWTGLTPGTFRKLN